MTKNELKVERRLERGRARIVKAEIARSKRQEQINAHIEEIFNVMTLILAIALIITVFVIDGLGIAAIPVAVYIVVGGYICIYSIFIYKQLTK